MSHIETITKIAIIFQNILSLIKTAYKIDISLNNP